MNKQQILVLGSNHITGQRIVAALADSDWAIPIVANTVTARTLSTVTAVVNATTGNGSTIRNVAKVLFTTAAQYAPTIRIVHISSMTVYGSATGEVTESSPLSGDVSDYAAAHVDAEALARTYANASVLRPGCEYGPGCGPWSERIGRWLLSRRIGDLGALGDGYCNLVYIDDVVAAVLQALRLPDIEGQIFNLGSPNPPTWNEYFVCYAKTLGAVPVRRITRRRLKIETKLFAIPLKALEIATQKLGISAKLFPDAIPPSFLSLTTQELKLDVTKAHTALGIEWTSIDEGLKRTADSLHTKLR